MDDVASARTENANLRKIQQKLLQWDVKDQPLAPLSARQLDALEALGSAPQVRFLFVKKHYLMECFC